MMENFKFLRETTTKEAAGILEAMEVEIKALCERYDVRLEEISKRIEEHPAKGNVCTISCKFIPKMREDGKGTNHEKT